MDVLTAYSWPGNIRELENLLERTLLFSDNNPIDESDTHEVNSSGTSPIWMQRLKCLEVVQI